MSRSLPELLYQVWDRILLYLPLGIMGMLALGTYFLVRSAPNAEVPPPAASVSNAPDYFMDAFSIKTFDASGRLRSEVLGDKMRHFPNTQFIEIEGIRIRSFDAQGRLTTASALRGLTNEDGSEVQLIGNAQVVREAQAIKGQAATARMEYRSEFLHAYMNTERIRSHLPVTLIRGRDRFSGDRMEYDHVQGNFSLEGRVRGTLFPNVQEK